MKVSLIIPTNSIERINNFIDSYEKLNRFKDSCQLVIVGNGEVVENKVNLQENYIFKRCEDKFNIVPFAKLRMIGMINSDCDFYMFLDDDHIFKEGSDDSLVRCLSFLSTHKDCGILQLQKSNKEKFGFYIKKNAHIWTSRGLFIRNIHQKENFDHLIGAGEDLLYSYEVLSKGYIPYEKYNSKIERGCNLPNDFKEKNDKSYNKKILDDNIIGYIRKKYSHPKWEFYGSLGNLGYPNLLRILIKNKLKNLI